MLVFIWAVWGLNGSFCLLYVLYMGHAAMDFLRLCWYALAMLLLYGLCRFYMGYAARYMCGVCLFIWFVEALGEAESGLASLAVL